MAEQYNRHIVYHKWCEDDIFRPLVSFESLKDAVAYFDKLIEQVPTKLMKIIDLEHIDMGDMLVAHECRELIDRIRSKQTEMENRHA